jgi:adenosine deaminase
VELVAAAFARGQAAQGIVYSELIVTARSHIAAGVAPHDLWAALRTGFSAAPATRIAIVVDAIRDFGPDELRETVRLVEDAEAPIVGIGLTGIEGTWPVEDFAFIRTAADRLGLGVEVHAGEMGPPESVAASLDILGADRIGHGVAVVRDPVLLTRCIPRPSSGRPDLERHQERAASRRWCDAVGVGILDARRRPMDAGPSRPVRRARVSARAGGVWMTF